MPVGRIEASKFNQKWNKEMNRERGREPFYTLSFLKIKNKNEETQRVYRILLMQRAGATWQQQKMNNIKIQMALSVVYVWNHM